MNSGEEKCLVFSDLFELMIITGSLLLEKLCSIDTIEAQSSLQLPLKDANCSGISLVG